MERSANRPYRADGSIADHRIADLRGGGVHQEPLAARRAGLPGAAEPGPSRHSRQRERGELDAAAELRVRAVPGVGDDSVMRAPSRDDRRTRACADPAFSRWRFW